MAKVKYCCFIVVIASFLFFVLQWGEMTHTTMHFAACQGHLQEIHITFENTYLSFSTWKLLALRTETSSNKQLTSGPRQNLSPVRKSGSILGILKPSPKSPRAKFGLSFSTASKIHFAGSRTFLEHRGIVLAVEKHWN